MTNIYRMKIIVWEKWIVSKITVFEKFLHLDQILSDLFINFKIIIEFINKSNYSQKIPEKMLKFRE